MSARGVLVTGASKGIGEACVTHLSKRGWTVFAGFRDPADGERLRALHGAAIVPVRLDVTSAEDIAAVAATIRDRLGEAGLAGVVNNAGIVMSGPFEFLPIEALKRQLDVNVVGQVAVTQAVLPLLRRSRGRVVFIGSISGLNSLPFVGAYAASKFALEAVADALRGELRPFGMRVTIIEPGVIATPIWETSIETADRLMADAPPELETYYGEMLRRLRQRAERGGEGLPPSRVAEVVERALTAKRPRARYLIGRDAKTRALLQRWLPDAVRDRLIARALARI